MVDSCIAKAEYGCPHADFEAKGVVTDEDGNGLYIKKELEVKLTQSKPGESTWDSGLYVAGDLNVKLDEEIACMYGTPIVEFSVKGRVGHVRCCPDFYRCRWRREWRRFRDRGCSGYFDPN